jgi:hypothetical protein
VKTGRNPRTVFSWTNPDGSWGIATSDGRVLRNEGETGSEWGIVHNPEATLAPIREWLSKFGFAGWEGS